MNLVDEHDRAAVGRLAQVRGGDHHLADFLDAREDGAERYELRLRHVRDDARQRRLAGARRTPEDDRLQQIALDRFAQRFARREQLLLSDELLERARAHAFRQRRRRGLFQRSVFRKKRVHRSRQP